ncbi:glycoside hydrolase family 57 protein [Sporohalobacter salinus]|uniref:glycoside hydrolase family 57 protein n=1 Tax=Sporohalobacter salinus TaxID=1494606 RepID=UPI00195F99D4|nr:1,4-alpha-glucan branching protein domain-containing protein [Sporohalobacter salinus]MBM7624972.1 1,4-alpha-glucan branching enzyme [Sporohalobacter salinus]
MSKNQGYLSLVLHAHLPFVRHPEHDNFLEERWLYEAITETYIPLIKNFEELRQDQIDYKLTISLSPTLISMLTDSLLQKRYINHLDQLIKLADREVKRTSNHSQKSKTARMYLDKFKEAKDIFINQYDKNLITAFKEFEELGYLELMICGATHGYLPLMKEYPEAVRAQIELAVNTYKQHFEGEPQGIWLPECGYYPGVDEILADYNLRFFILDTHGLLYATPRPKYGVFAPIYTESGVAAFGRDNKSSKNVWSAEEGYPGDYNYREYYRDIGFDLPFDYIQPYINQKIRVNTGMKYYKITGEDCNLQDKELYDHQKALDRVKTHAKDFIEKQTEQIEKLNDVMDRKPIITAPYDAELFGHWWYEGPDFLNSLIRQLDSDEEIIDLISPSDYLKEYPKNQVCEPPMCSWGANGYNDVWLEESNDWIYRHLHQAADKMIELATEYTDPDQLLERTLNQAARELLLAQSSDWAFIMKTNTMVEYAVKRTKSHIHRFFNLYNQIKTNDIDIDWLEELENKDNIFPNINYSVYSKEN